MRLYKTGHPIADTVSDLIGEVPDGNYNIVYGILRHSLGREGKKLLLLDRGFWGAGHFDGYYRLAAPSRHNVSETQPIYSPDYPLSEPHGQTLEPWRKQAGYTLICPPTAHVCDFFKINFTGWLLDAIKGVEDRTYTIRHKGNDSPIDWENINQIVTFNSTVGIEALRRGIEVISSPEHSTIGSYQQHNSNITFGYDRNMLFDFMQGHQFKLADNAKISRIISHYLERSA